MKISGFTMVRNAGKFYFPIKEAILSVLPIVDEFIVALGDCDEGDDTQEQIMSIGSDKVKVFNRTWDEQAYIDGHIFKLETDFALDQCTGDWCLYLQADEVVHEDSLPAIVDNCKKYLNEDIVDGLLMNYFHFWGDYEHHLPYHGWCKKEIRIIKNGRGIRSYKDALSFRMPDDEKLKVKRMDVDIYHYGYVRPPDIMRSKKKEQDGMHLGIETAEMMYKNLELPFDYGPLNRLPKFKGSHPKVMHERILLHNWKDQLNYNGKSGSIKVAPRDLFKHEKWKYRMLSKLEDLLDTEIFSFKNYKLLK